MFSINYLGRIFEGFYAGFDYTRAKVFNSISCKLKPYLFISSKIVYRCHERTGCTFNLSWRESVGGVVNPETLLMNTSPMNRYRRTLAWFSTNWLGKIYPQWYVQPTKAAMYPPSNCRVSYAGSVAPSGSSTH